MGDNKSLEYCKNCGEAYCANCNKHEGCQDFCSPGCAEIYKLYEQRELERRELARRAIEEYWEQWEWEQRRIETEDI